MADRAPSYQRYPQDFEASPDCQMMTLEEYGAYNRLLDKSWLSTPQCYLPNDTEKLAKLLGISHEVFLKLWNVLAKKFKIKGEMIFNARLLKERVKQRKRFRQAKQNGKLGGRPKKTREVSEEKTRTVSQMKAALETGTKPLSSSFTSSSAGFPYSEIGDKNLDRRSTKSCPPQNGGRSAQLFAAFWNHTVYPRLEGKQSAWKAWCRLHVDDELFAVMVRWLDLARKSEQWQDPNKIPHPATWLNQRRWEGDPPPLPVKPSGRKPDTVGAEDSAATQTDPEAMEDAIRAYSERERKSKARKAEGILAKPEKERTREDRQWIEAYQRNLAEEERDKEPA